MQIKSHVRRFAGQAVLGVATLSTGSLGTLAAAHPASAAEMLAQVQSLITCGTTAACVSGANNSSGPGVAGTSSKGYGVAGTSTSNFGVMGSSNAAGGAGVRGQTSGANGAGVSGYSAHGYGVNGSSSDGFGVYGSTGGNGVGAYGGSVSGNGVRGRSLSAEGVLGLGATGGDFSGSTYGVVGRAASAGAYPLITFDEKKNSLLYVRHSGAVVGSASGVGPFGTGADFSGTAMGIVGRAPVGGYPLYLTDNYGNPLFSVDGQGNVAFHGTMNSYARTAGGATMQSFSAKTTLPTVEDTGTAQLVAGAAAVRLDPAFAASIDVRAGYHIFLTPSGDTRGLFVAARSADGFIVHESQGGHATVAFDYRIVATASGQAGQRMSLTRAAAPLARPQAPLLGNRP